MKLLEVRNFRVNLTKCSYFHYQNELIINIDQLTCLAAIGRIFACSGVRPGVNSSDDDTANNCIRI